MADCLCDEMRSKMQHPENERYGIDHKFPVINCVSFDCPKHGRVTFDNRHIPSSGPTYHTDPWAEYGVSKARERDAERKQEKKRHPDFRRRIS